MKNKQAFNLWPLSIAGLVLVVVVLIIWTVYFALQNPVQNEDSFLITYQEADSLINSIQRDQKEFSTRYILEWQNVDSERKLNLPPSHSRSQKIEALFHGLNFSNGFAFVIKPKTSGTGVPDIESIQALLTRPHTKVDDKVLYFEHKGDNFFQTQPVVLPSYGRWLIQGAVNYQNKTPDRKIGYFRFEFFVDE